MKKLLLALFLGFVLVLAACGNDDDDNNAGNDTGDNNTGTTEQTDEGTTDQGTTDEGTTDEGTTDEGTTDEGTTENAGEGDTVDTAAAEELFQNNCSMCHGGDLTGGVGPNLTKVGSKYSQDEIHDIILNGKGGMPPQNVSDEDANTIAGWLAAKK